MSGRKSSILALFLLCEAIGAIALVGNAYDWTRSFENITIDWRFALRYSVRKPMGKVHVSDQVVLAGIDQLSVDPKHSNYSDRWGAGGWFTRENWNQAIAPLALEFQPKVFAYDILLTAHRTASSTTNSIDDFVGRKKTKLSLAVLGNDFPRTELLNLLDQGSNGSFANNVETLSESKEGGLTELDLLTAITLNFSETEQGHAWSLPEDEGRIKRLVRRAIPSSSLEHVPKDMPLADNALLPFDPLPAGPISMAYINVPRDPDGVVRRVPLVMAFRNPLDRDAPVFLPSMALKACMLKFDIDPASPQPGTGIHVDFGKEIVLTAKDQTFHIPIDRRGSLALNFEGNFEDFTQLTYVDLLDYKGFLSQEKKLSNTPLNQAGLEIARKIRDKIRGKIVLAGLTFTGGSDIGPCPMDPNMPLVFIHMTAIDNILRQSFFWSMNTFETALYISALMIGMWLLNAFTSPRFSVHAEVWLLIATQIVPLVLACFRPLYVPMVLPGFSVMFAFGAIYLYRYNTEQQERLAIRKKFSTAVSPRVLRFMEEHPEQLVGQRMEATMFFSDVAGFTSFSEKLDPVQLSQVLNDYLTPMADLILARDGYLNKFAGDGIMAVWGVPDKQPDHATQACLCALEQQAKVDEIRLYFHNKYSVELKVRMGLNSGIVSAGMMGSAARQDYTVMGDAVNLAARLEPAAKDYGIRTLIGQNTYELAKAEIVARPMDRLVVTGKTEPVQIYELMAARTKAKPEHFRLAETFDHAIQLYWKRDWTAAMKEFEEILREFPKDSASFVFVQRIQEFLTKPPPDSWKGEYVRTSKH